METNRIETKNKISTLWVVVMFCMAFADIVGFMTPGALAEIMNETGAPFEVTEGLLLLFSVFIALPIIMIYLSKTLAPKINRWLNIGVGVLTIVFVAGLGSASLTYYFFAGIEIISILIIIWTAWKWPLVDN